MNRLLLKKKWGKLVCNLLHFWKVAPLMWSTMITVLTQTVRRSSSDRLCYKHLRASVSLRSRQPMSVRGGQWAVGELSASVRCHWVRLKKRANTLLLLHVEQPPPIPPLSYSHGTEIEKGLAERARLVVWVRTHQQEEKKKKEREKKSEKSFSQVSESVEIVNFRLLSISSVSKLKRIPQR